jgi:hypothetical protein
MSAQPKSPQTTDDLKSSDAQAFLAANDLQPDERTSAASEFPEGSPDEQVTHAIEDVRAVRTANNRPRQWIFYAIIAALVVGLFTLEFINISHPKTTTEHFGGALNVQTPDSSTTQGLGTPAQQQIKTCSQVTNAALGAC